MPKFASQTMATRCVLMVITLIVGFGPANVASTSRGNRGEVQTSTSDAERWTRRFRRSSDTPNLPRLRPIYHLGISGTDVNDHHVNTRHPSTHDGGASVKGTHPAALLHHSLAGGGLHAVPVSADEKPLVRLKRLKRSTFAVSAQDRQHHTSVFGPDTSSAHSPSKIHSSVSTSRGSSSSSSISKTVPSEMEQNVDQGRMRNDTHRIKPKNRDSSRIRARQKGVPGDGESDTHSELIKTIKSLIRKDKYKGDKDFGGHQTGGGHRNNRKTWSKTDVTAVKFRQRQRQPLKFNTDRLMTPVVGHSYEDFSYHDHRATNRIKGGQKHAGLAVIKQSGTKTQKIAEPAGGGVHHVLHSGSSQKALTGSKTRDAVETDEGRVRGGYRRQKAQGYLPITSPKTGGISGYRTLSQSRRRPLSSEAATIDVTDYSDIHERSHASPKTSVKTHQLLADGETDKRPSGDTITTMKRQRRADMWKPAMATQSRKRRSGSSSAVKFKGHRRLHHLPSRTKRSPVDGRSFKEKLELVKREQMAVHRRLAALTKKRSTREIIVERPEPNSHLFGA